MRAGILSAGQWILGDVREETPTNEGSITDRDCVQAPAWDLAEFEREQLRGLARQLFFSGTNPAVRQVVFSGIDAETDVRSLCSQVAESVAAETGSDVAFVDESFTSSASFDRFHGIPVRTDSTRIGSLRESAKQLADNLFWVKGLNHHPATKPQQLYLEELRQEFDYSVVAAPPAATSMESFAMARCADGIVLVLSAQRTRRATALKVRNDLGNIRLLGTVLCEREFPIPWGIYRRL